jgi:hypothetical protein
MERQELVIVTKEHNQLIKDFDKIKDQNVTLTNNVAFYEKISWWEGGTIIALILLIVLAIKFKFVTLL